jgi:3-oxoacyl-[acyl-carrier protein] reductase
MTDAGERVALVTGTRKGIGRHLVDHFLERGFRVVGCSRQPIEETIEGYTHYELDVSDERAVVRMLTNVKRSHGGVDVLVNNAGVASMNHSLLTPGRSVHEVFGANVYGTFFFCREAAKLMRRKKRGAIVNLSTVAVPLRLEGEAIYAASKAAVESLTRVLAREFADFGVTVNALGPTPIETDLIRSIDAKKIDALIARQAIRRFGRYEDVVNVIDFFVSPNSGFITGQVIYLGGVG